MLIRINMSHSLDPDQVKEAKVIKKSNGHVLLAITFQGSTEPNTFIPFGDNRTAKGKAEAALTSIVNASMGVFDK